MTAVPTSASTEIRRLRETERLLARDDVDYVSIKVSATVAPHNPWAFDEAVGRQGRIERSGSGGEGGESPHRGELAAVDPAHLAELIELAHDWFSHRSRLPRE